VTNEHYNYTKLTLDRAGLNLVLDFLKTASGSPMTLITLMSTTEGYSGATKKYCAVVKRYFWTSAHNFLVAPQ